MAFPAKKPDSKPDFLDDVVDEMGSDKDKYGASMESDDEDSEDSGDDDVKEDRIMAAKTLMKGLGIQGDATKVADALEAFVKTCM